MAGHLRGELRPSVTDSEREALHLRALGYTGDEAAQRLGITRTAFYHRIKNAYRRLGADGLIDALRRLGWLTVPGEKR